MKLWIHILCFYLFALTAVPTVKVVKMHFSKCQSSCQKKNSSKPDSCEKGKCILSLNFNPGQFIISQIQVIAINNNFEIQKTQNSYYTEFLTEKHKENIWQPPEITIIS